MSQRLYMPEADLADHIRQALSYAMEEHYIASDQAPLGPDRTVLVATVPDPVQGTPEDIEMGSEVDGLLQMAMANALRRIRLHAAVHFQRRREHPEENDADPVPVDHSRRPPEGGPEPLDRWNRSSRQGTPRSNDDADLLPPPPRLSLIHI